MLRQRVGQTVALVAGLLLASCEEKDQAFQLDADQRRLEHFQEYVRNIEEYRSRTGEVPLAREDAIPTYVYISHSEQKLAFDPIDRGPEFRYAMVSVADFVNVLERGLGRDLQELYDPELSGVCCRPNFYVYLAAGDQYFFAVHLSKNPGFGSLLGSYYKVEATNRPQTPEQLSPEGLEERAFQQALNRPMKKRAFFDARDKMYARIGRDSQ